jgi:hypothetical protein
VPSASEWSHALANIASTSSAVARCRQIVTLPNGRRRVPIGRNRWPLSVGISGRIPADSANSANKCALGRQERLFAGARIIDVVGFASPSESYDGRLQGNPHVTDPLLCRSNRAWRGLVMEQTDSALNVRTAGTDARLNLRSNLNPCPINLARTWTCVAR